MTPATGSAARRNWENAERHYENTLELAERLPHRVDQARVRYWCARMLFGRDAPGDRERALAMLGKAHTLSEEMGMNGLIRAISECYNG